MACLEAPGSSAAFHLYLGPEEAREAGAAAPGAFADHRARQLDVLSGDAPPDGPHTRCTSGSGTGGGRSSFSRSSSTFPGASEALQLRLHAEDAEARPQIQRIKDRYKKVKQTDPRYQQMNQEIMTLYKEHKVSPVSGCLPMLSDDPLLFRLLSAPDVVDRAAPRAISSYGFMIYRSSTHISFCQSSWERRRSASRQMTPQTTVDPVQAKIMKFMPVMFTFILAWAPAGLVLYWFSNNSSRWFNRW